MQPKFACKTVNIVLDSVLRTSDTRDYTQGISYHFEKEAMK